MITKKEIDQQVAKNIKSLRKEQDISIAELARLTGKNERDLRFIESVSYGITPHTLYRLCEALDCDSKDILGF